MPYTKNDPPWANGGAPGISAERLNHLETQYSEAKTDLDAKLHATAGHKHTGVAGDGPRLTSTGLDAEAATDTVVGNRTVTDSSAPTGDASTLTNLFSWLGYMVKAITGKANWRTAPAISLETVNGRFHGTTGHSHDGTAGNGPKVPDVSLASGVTTASTANTIVKRDASGSVRGRQLVSDVASGTPPLQVSSSTSVSQLNADLLDGLHASDIYKRSNNTIPNGVSSHTVTLGWRPGLVYVGFRTGDPNYYPRIILRADGGASYVAMLGSTGTALYYAPDGSAQPHVVITDTGFTVEGKAAMYQGVYVALN